MGASGTTTVDFGAFPGMSETSVDVTGQTGLVSSSKIEAWIQPIATSDHSADEHVIERIRVIGRYLADGQLRIHAFDDASPAFVVPNTGMAQTQELYGQYTVGWVWV